MAPRAGTIILTLYMLIFIGVAGLHLEADLFYPNYLYTLCKFPPIVLIPISLWQLYQRCIYKRWLNSFLHACSALFALSVYLASPSFEEQESHNIV
jgi:hypothetical protein